MRIGCGFDFGMSHEKRLNLEVSLKELYFAPPHDVQREAMLHLSNHSSSVRLAIKVLCSDNRQFLTKPVYAIIEASAELCLTVSRQPGPFTGRAEKIVIRCCEAVPEGQNAKELFRGCPEQEQEQHGIQLVCLESLLQMTPAEAVFFEPLDRVNLSEHRLINHSSTKRFAIKVKCSDNSRYRIRPVYLLLRPNQQEVISIRRLPDRSLSKDRALIQFVQVLTEESEPKCAFQSRSHEEVEQMEILLLATKQPPIRTVPAEAVFPLFDAEKLPNNCEHKVFNLSTCQRLVIKVKCSDNHQFRIRPTHAFIEPSNFINLILSRVASPSLASSKNRLILLYKEVSDPDATDPKSAFANSIGPVREHQVTIRSSRQPPVSTTLRTSRTRTALCSDRRSQQHKHF